MEVVIIGSGNLATHLGLALKAKGVTIKEVYSKNIIHAQKLGDKLDAPSKSNTADIYRNADIYFYVLKDSALQSFLNEINIPNGIHIHTSGGIPMNVFEKHVTKFGVFYPLQTFSINKPVDFSTIPVCIEASDMEVQKELVALANLISPKYYILNSEKREKLHLAAVIASNFTNYMYDIAYTILKDADINFEIIHPLIIETAEKIKTMTPFEAQTGPAVRIDQKTIKKHLSLLRKNRDFRNIYRLLSKNIIKRHKPTN
jgi:predicted short-subunit dehydrogenase-like oxidoreductase (DUF2520 family)